MKTYDRIAGFFFLGAGLFFTHYARTVEIGDWLEPGPGFLPLCAGLILVAMSSAFLLKTLARQTSKGIRFFPQKDSWKRVLPTFVALVAYNFLLQPLGFTIVTFLFIAFLVKWIFPQSWLRSIITGGLTALGAYVLFVMLLKTQLPKGFLGF